MTAKPILDYVEDIIMKGDFSTPEGMRKVLNRAIVETAARILSHIADMADGKIKPAPGEADAEGMLRNVAVSHLHFHTKLLEDHTATPMDIDGRIASLIISAYFQHKGDFRKAAERLKTEFKEVP